MPPPPPLPRVTIRFCTQCKWLLRAAYYAQELLSTFGAALGEVALQPASGGAFVVALEAEPRQREPLVVWDRARDGGFPETKELKRRVRDVVDPARHLGHVDGHRAAAEPADPAAAPAADPAATDRHSTARDAADRGTTDHDVAKPAAPSGPAPPCDDCASPES